MSENKCQYLPTVHTYCICTQYMLLASLHGAVFILLEECCPFVLPYKRGQSLFLLQCCLIEGTDSFPPLITSRQPSGGKPWDMATFSLLRQPIMEVNWNSWVEMFAGSAHWGECFCKPQVWGLFLQFILAFKNPTEENPHTSVYQVH